MDTATIRAKIRAKQYLIYDHALTEAFKDGLTVADMVYVALNGEIIESYPKRKRCLLSATLSNGVPVHVLIDHRFSQLQIVTTYIPDKREWIDFRIRKPKRVK
jgi:hypothetical protein